MKIPLMLLSLLIAAAPLVAREVTIKTDEGSLDISVDEVQRDGTIAIAQVIALLKKKLDKLEDDSLSRLGRLERTEALREMKSIRILIAALPRNGFIVVDGKRPESAGTDIGAQPMSDRDFDDLLNHIRNKKFSSERIAAIKNAADGNYFKLEQLLRIMTLMRDATTTELIGIVKTVYPRVTNRAKNYLIYDYFKFQSDKDSVKRIIQDAEKK